MTRKPATRAVSIASPPTKGADPVQLLARIDEARERWNLLNHPFYRRWECGELTREDLAYYAGQYRHAVVALAETAGQADAEHAREEAEHISLWDSFATAMGAEAADPSAETAGCVSAWLAPEDPLGALAVLYAIEAGQPDVSQTKLEGLAEHYGVDRGEPGAAYFVLHAELDHEHAATSRALLEAHSGDEDRLLGLAENALRANWMLLDGVEKSTKR
jgi:pyrroloquinoline-quinone synthase